MRCPIFIAPQYSGLVGAVAFGAGSVATIILPYVVAALTPMGSRGEWNNVFFLGSGIALVFGALNFIVFGSADLQSWAKETTRKIETIEKF